jgi:hypothetical protein
MKLMLKHVGLLIICVLIVAVTVQLDNYQFSGSEALVFYVELLMFGVPLLISAIRQDRRESKLAAIFVRANGRHE